MRAHRARRHRGLHRRRRARPPGAARALPPVRRAPGAARRRPSGASPRPSACGPDGVLRAADADGVDGARRRASPAPSPRRSRSACCTPTATPSTSGAIGAALRERLASVHVSLSHEVVGTFREYERAATTEVDAALSPLLARYLRRLRRRAARRRACPSPAIMQSSGGLADARRPRPTTPRSPCSAARPAARPPRRCSPSAAASPTCCASTWAARRATCASSRAARVRETTAREVGGRPLALPMVDIHTVGAGGGSIAWRDAGGALRVGPAQRGRRARARLLRARRRPSRRSPTPTSSSATSTPDAPLAGDVALDADAAHARRRARWPTSSASTSRACAEGIVRVANAEMVRALRVMTVERGIDPRGFALLAFGGAGPLHAAAIAEELGMTRILVPRASGVLSALGLAAADRRARRPAHRARRRRRAASTALRDEVARRWAASRGRGRLRRALPRPVPRADRARRATRDAAARALRGRCTRSATATATPTARSSS